MELGESYRLSEEEPATWALFCATVRTLGVIEPVVVAPVAGRLVCVAGHRRLAACRAVGRLVPVRRAPEGVHAALVALVENTQRRALRPAEIAVALTALRPSYGSAAELGAAVGLSERYTANLLRIREKACPELWQLFVSHGEGVDWGTMAEVVTHPRERQVAEWNRRHRAQGGSGPRRPRRRAQELEAMRREFRACHGRKGPYWNGVREGLRRALSVLTGERAEGAAPTAAERAGSS